MSPITAYATRWASLSLPGAWGSFDWWESQKMSPAQATAGPYSHSRRIAPVSPKRTQAVNLTCRPNARSAPWPIRGSRARAAWSRLPAVIRGPHHALAPLLAVALAACGKDASLPLDMGPGDVAVLVSTVDGRAVPHTRPYVAGEAIQVPSDPDKPIYAWVLRASDQVTPQGAAVPAELLAATAARLVPDPADPSGATGACGRCLLATATAPMVVQAGDACPLPHFMRGSVWRKVDGAFVCRGAEGSSVCPAGDAADDGEIEEVRRRLRIDRPGACACAEPEAPDALQGMEMRAIAPAANPIPLTIYAKNSAGQVAGFSQAGSGLFEPATGRADVTPISEWPITVKTTVALRNGDFLVTGDAFNSGAVDEQSYYRFRPGPAGLEGPTRVEPSAPVLAERMRYLGGPTNDFRST
jgi:hypothetical protein